MTKASDNAFPSLLITEGTEPSAPAAGKQRVYIDSTSHKVKRTDSAGTEVTIDASAYPKLQYEVDYAQITSSASITGTSEASPTDVVTGSSVAFDGSTIAILEFYAWVVNPDSGAVNRNLRIAFYDGTTSLGSAAFFSTEASGVAQNVPCFIQIRYTPSNASHTFKVAAWVSSGTGTVGAGAGGAAANRPAYLRVSKLSPA